jgi:hypothetical protein
MFNNVAHNQRFNDVLLSVANIKDLGALSSNYIIPRYFYNVGFLTFANSIITNLRNSDGT